MIYQYRCEQHPTIVVSVDTERRHVAAYAKGKPPSECLLPQVAHLACGDARSDEDQPDRPAGRVAEMAKDSPGTHAGCVVKRL